ncbi:unnamed protein product [Brassica napus]|uniref:(rape) hypothetical protein n=1 Tax=Brassica napus TaxID=3708 RepID=A0A816JRJ7_BRANA|nr:unnamed protein product [Brassica napus]
MVELGGESAFWVSLRSGLRFPVSRSTPPRWCERVAERGCFLSPDPVAWHQAPGPWRSRPVVWWFHLFGVEFLCDLCSLSGQVGSEMFLRSTCLVIAVAAC